MVKSGSPDGGPRKQDQINIVLKTAHSHLPAKSSIAKDKLCDEEFDKLVLETSSRVSKEEAEEADEAKEDETEPTSPSSADCRHDDNTSSSSSSSSSMSSGEPSPSVNNSGNNSDYNRLKQPKRPMNAFMVWGQAIRRNLHMRFSNVQNALLSKSLGRVWRSLDPSEKEPYVRRANMIKANHKRDYPDYRYQPRRIQERRNKGSMLIGISLRHPVSDEPRRFASGAQHHQNQYHQSHHHHHHQQQQQQQQQQNLIYLGNNSRKMSDRANSFNSHNHHDHRHHQDNQASSSAAASSQSFNNSNQTNNLIAGNPINQGQQQQQHHLFSDHPNQISTTLIGNQHPKEVRPIQLGDNGVQTFEYQPYSMISTNQLQQQQTTATRTDVPASFNEPLCHVVGDVGDASHSQHNQQQLHETTAQLVSHTNQARNHLVGYHHHHQQEQHEQQAMVMSGDNVKQHPGYLQRANQPYPYTNHQEVHFSQQQQHHHLAAYNAAGIHHHQQQQQPELQAVNTYSLTGIEMARDQQHEASLVAAVASSSYNHHHQATDSSDLNKAINSAISNYYETMPMTATNMIE